MGVLGVIRPDCRRHSEQARLRTKSAAWINWCRFHLAQRAQRARQDQLAGLGQQVLQALLAPLVNLPSNQRISLYSNSAQSAPANTAVTINTLNVAAALNGWTLDANSMDFSSTATGVYLVNYQISIATSVELAGSATVASRVTLDGVEVQGSFAGLTQTLSVGALQHLTLARSFIMNYNTAGQTVNVQFTCEATVAIDNCALAFDANFFFVCYASKCHSYYCKDSLIESRPANMFGWSANRSQASVQSTSAKDTQA